MFLEKFNSYNEQYIKGVKIISVRSFWLKSEPSVKKPTRGNYDLFFNKEGILLHSLHFEGGKKSKTIYGYDKKNKLRSAIELTRMQNQLLELSIFDYDELGRLESESCSSYYTLNLASEASRQYTYSENRVSVLYCDDSLDCKAIFENTYDNDKNLIEEKTIALDKHFIDGDGNPKIIQWEKLEYNSKGEKVRIYSFDANGVQIEVIDYFPFFNGLITGYRLIGDNINKAHEYKYTFNDNGHWISELFINDGINQSLIERVFEFYNP